MQNIEKKLNKLKDYFTNREDVFMAFAFGSRVKGQGNVHRHYPNILT